MKRTHGLTGSRIYLIWQNFRKRCSQPDHPQWKDYGGRGITVCEEWRGSDCFPVFLSWALTHGYREGLFIDRENNHLGYSPENCRFVTRDVQNNNTRANVVVTAYGETKTLAEWSKDDRCKIDTGQLGWRIKKGWSPETAISTPPIEADPNHCPHGHEYTPENTFQGERGRQCRACSRIRQTVYNHRIRGTKAA